MRCSAIAIPKASFRGPTGSLAARLVECETERGTVGDVDREARRSPARPARHGLAEHGDVGVVAAEDALVERLLRRPGGRRYGTGCR